MKITLKPRAKTDPAETYTGVKTITVEQPFVLWENWENNEQPRNVIYLKINDVLIEEEKENVRSDSLDSPYSGSGGARPDLLSKSESDSTPNSGQSSTLLRKSITVEGDFGRDFERVWNTVGVIAKLCIKSGYGFQLFGKQNDENSFKFELR